MYKSFILKPLQTISEQKIADGAVVTYVARAPQVPASQSKSSQKVVCLFAKYQKAVEFTLPITATLRELKACIRQKIVGNTESLKIYFNKRLLQDES